MRGGARSGSGGGWKVGSTVPYFEKWVDWGVLGGG
jgi:hypothetical protein